MKKEPLVSIIMPVYNTEPFLEECLESILKQSYSNWELVAVDDFSTDRSTAILNHFAKKDHRIMILPNSHKGIIPALRLSYRYASGEYITRMDADDIATPNKIKSLLTLLLSTGTGYVATGLVKYFHHEGKLGDGYKKYQKWLNNISLLQDNFKYIYTECCIASPAWMLHRQDFEKVGAFNSDKYPEDYDLVFRFYQAKLKVISTQEIIHLWRDYSNRTSRTNPDYADNRFIEIKTHYFYKLDYKPSLPLILWGCGNKGKAIAKQLIEHNLDFRWVCNSPNKWGHIIYGITILNTLDLDILDKFQVIIAVSQRHEKIKIQDKLQAIQSLKEIQYFSFF